MPSRLKPCAVLAALQVYSANDVVYEDIAAGFTQLCSSLLPSLELQLVRIGAQAHEGLQFRWGMRCSSNHMAASTVLYFHVSCGLV